MWMMAWTSERVGTERLLCLSVFFAPSSCVDLENFLGGLEQGAMFWACFFIITRAMCNGTGGAFMSLSVECWHCHTRNSPKNATCSKYGLRFRGNWRTYWIELRDGEGKKIRKRLGMVSKDTAREHHNMLKRSLDDGSYYEKPLTWGDVVDASLRRLDAEGKSTIYIKDSKRFLDRMSDFWGANLPVTEITSVMVKEFRVSLMERDRKLSEVSCNRHLAAGKAAWNHSIEDLPNPFSRVTFFNEREKEIAKYLTEDQRVNLLEAAQMVSPTLFQMIVVGIGTGLRKSNVLNLRHDEVDFEARIISVVQKRKRPLEIPMIPPVAEILAQVPDNGTPWFWVNPTTGVPYLKDWRKPWQKAKALAGIPGDFQFKFLRHHFGTLAYQASHDLQAVQRLLGHTQITTTQRYAKALSDHLREVAEGVEIFLPTNTPTTTDKLQ
jgi:integrase